MGMDIITDFDRHEDDPVEDERIETDGWQKIDNWPIQTCGHCQNCFYKKGGGVICTLTCQPVSKKRTCDKWEEPIVEQILRVNFDNERS